MSGDPRAEGATRAAPAPGAPDGAAAVFGAPDQAVAVVGAPDLAVAVETALGRGERLAGLLGGPAGDGGFVLRAVLAGPGRLSMVEARLPPGERAYPAVTARVPAAAWYERELHDRYGLEPVGHPRLDPLVLPLLPGHAPPGLTGDWRRPVTPDAGALDAHASGEGMFTIPYGPVRSGVGESVEYLVETFGEDIPRVRSRVHHKHRGVDLRFEDLDLADGVLVAERVEGTVSVAHALAYCRALESLAGVDVPRGAELVRLLHAELERAANHLESVIRHAEGAYQVVAHARMTVHKERLMRLRARLCGHRFGRDVVVPGGVRGPLLEDPARARGEVSRLAAAIAADAGALMATPSFVDRLRGTGLLPGPLVRDHGALGPVGRGSGLDDDTRASRPYGAYRWLGFEPAAHRSGGDALARQEVRLEEIDESLRLAAAALDELAGAARGELAGAARGELDGAARHELDGAARHELDGAARPGWRVPVRPVDGVALSAVEAPQGELLYLVEVEGGRPRRVKPRCAAFHNFALFPFAFRGDIFTDFVFIEASFGLSIAGVSG